MRTTGGGAVYRLAAATLVTRTGANVFLLILLRYGFAALSAVEVIGVVSEGWQRFEVLQMKT
jgi:hypothetical protein